MAAHRSRFRVYYEDTDAGGVMYHAQYLAFAERGRSEALRALDIPAADLARMHGIVFVVRRLEADYRRPLRLDDLVTVSSALVALHGATARLEQVLEANDTVCATLKVTLAFMRMADGRPVRLPPRWSDGLRGLLPG